MLVIRAAQAHLRVISGVDDATKAVSELAAADMALTSAQERLPKALTAAIRAGGGPEAVVEDVTRAGNGDLAVLEARVAKLSHAARAQPPSQAWSAGLAGVVVGLVAGGAPDPATLDALGAHVEAKDNSKCPALQLSLAPKPDAVPSLAALLPPGWAGPDWQVGDDGDARRTRARPSRLLRRGAGLSVSRSRRSACC